MLALPDEEQKTGLMDKIVLSFVYATGARDQEVCDLKVKDIRFDTVTAVVTLTGKESKIRKVAITP